MARVHMSAPSSFTLVLATGNRHKAAEIQSILGSGARFMTLDDLPGAPHPIEDARTFAGNALKKAVGLSRWLASRISDSKFQISDPSWVLADDSGLEVDYLRGAPGVHSARFAAIDTGKLGNSSDADNNARLLHLLKDVPAEQRTARFRCVLALTHIAVGSAALDPEFFEGTCEGRIDFSPRGQGGFGYDPLFIPNGFDRSFAELGEGEKNRISHRARALSALRDWLRTRSH